MKTTFAVQCGGCSQPQLPDLFEINPTRVGAQILKGNAAIESIPGNSLQLNHAPGCSEMMSRCSLQTPSHKP